MSAMRTLLFSHSTLPTIRDALDRRNLTVGVLLQSGVMLVDEKIGAGSVTMGMIKHSMDQRCRLLIHERVADDLLRELAGLVQVEAY